MTTDAEARFATEMMRLQRKGDRAEKWAWRLLGVTILLMTPGSVSRWGGWYALFYIASSSSLAAAVTCTHEWTKACKRQKVIAEERIRELLGDA